MKNVIVSIMLLAISAFSQQLNTNGYNDTCQIVGFCADSFKLSKAFNLTNGQDRILAFVFDDTANAYRKKDTVVCEIGCRLGAQLLTLSGVLDTIWTSCIPLDTCNTLTLTTMYDKNKRNTGAMWGLNSDDTPLRPHNQIDTTIGTSSSGIFIPLLPYWASFIKFYVKGLAGNRATIPIKARFTFITRGYVYVRTK
jgi:hypothetical protein